MWHVQDSQVFANPWLTRVGDELWFYYASNGRAHSTGTAAEGVDKHSGIYRATMRLDGFVSVDGGYTGGEFTTPPLLVGGVQAGELVLNCDGSAGGWVQVEVQDVSCRALAGFTLEESVAVIGNSVQHRVRWNHKRRLSEAEMISDGQPVRFRFVMRAMALYAFQIEEYIES